jgi:hypothetical protein
VPARSDTAPLTPIRMTTDLLPGGCPSKPDQTRGSFGLESNNPFARGLSIGAASKSSSQGQFGSKSQPRMPWSSISPLRPPFKSGIPKFGVKPHERSYSTRSLDQSLLQAGTDKRLPQTEQRNSVTSHSTNQPVETAHYSDDPERSVMPVSKA